jgi:hypothetical protein
MHARSGLFVLLCFGVFIPLPVFSAPRVWEKQELTFTAARHFANPYTDVDVWVDLSGPHFKKARVWLLRWWQSIPRAGGRHRIGPMELDQRI